MKSFHGKTISIGLFIASMFLFTHCLTYGNLEDRTTKSFAVRPGGTLTLESDIGSIEVRGMGTDSVEIEILKEVRTNDEKRAKEILEDFDVRFNHSGNDVSIKGINKKRGIGRLWNNIGKHLRVKYIIAVPSEYNLDLQTSEGSISADDITGEVLSNTSGGSLKFDNIKGDIKAKTSGGSITIGEVMGRSDIRTSGGSIHIKRAEGPLNAHTSGGSITVEEVMGAIDADTSGGSVKAYLSKQPESDCSLTTSGGSITVRLPDNMGLDIDAKASGGRIHTDFPISLSGEISRSAMRAKMNGGGPELYLRTSGGSIYLKKL